MQPGKAAAAAALAQEAAAAREADATAAAKAASAHASAALAERNRPKSEVMKRADAFDRLDKDAKVLPCLLPSSVSVGEKSSKLLMEFERREAEARAAPVLRDVKATDVRNSKIFDKLKEFEANDARARAEPRLEKTFSQRQIEANLVPVAA